MTEKKITFSFLTAISIILICIVSIVMLSITYYKKNNTVNQTVIKSTLHEYDYIIEVDGTDSTLIYTVFDHNHQLVGIADSRFLDELITKDNL